MAITLLQAIKAELKQELKEIVDRGKRIYSKLSIIDVEYSKYNAKEYSFAIPSESNTNTYTVELEVNLRLGEIYGECDCVYFEQNQTHCKHIVCAMLLLQDLSKNEAVSALKEEIFVNPAESVIEKWQPVKWSYLSDQNLDRVSMKNSYHYQALLWNRNNWVLQDDNENNKLFIQYNQRHKPAVKHIGKNQLEVTCQCKKSTATLLCDHVIILLRKIRNERGVDYFSKTEDWSAEKDELLRKFGLSTKDKLANSFKFGFDYHGNFILVEKPSNILTADSKTVWSEIKTKLGLIGNEQKGTLPDKKVEEFDNFVIQFSANASEPNLQFYVLGSRAKKTGDGIVYKKMVLRNATSLSLLSQYEPEAAKILAQVSYDVVDSINGSSNANWWHQFNSSSQVKWIGLCRNVISKLSALESKPTIVQEFQDKKYTAVSFEPNKVALSFRISREKDFIEVQAFAHLAEEVIIPVTECEFVPWFLLKYENRYYLLHEDQIEAVKLFSKNPFYIPFKDFDLYNNAFIAPLSTQYDIVYDESMNVQEEDFVELLPILHLHLGEVGNEYLTLSPSWKYNDILFPFHSNKIENTNGIFRQIKRNEVEENKYKAWLIAQHPQFANRIHNLLYLTIPEATHNSWYFNFLQSASDNNVEISGKEQLKNFNYNTASPELKVMVGNGIDWFDVKIEVNYDGLVVSLSELKKAILAQQKFIKLSDGSLGIIPQEWIDKYGYLFQSAKLKDDQLQVSKFQWTLIDALYDEKSDDEIALELKRKKELLHNVDKQSIYPIPKKLNAKLRDYQLAGFQWLCTLDSLEWGGCLADDMGLGKTLQTLSFLTHLKSKKPKTHLIVCPTSLIYNWESEIQKFCNHLKYHIHYGAERDRSVDSFSKYDIIITSYGMVRSDIKEFSSFHFHYVILDESHTIKNPAAQMTKAVSLLKCKNKIVLSGTPLQNNTLDIYSQMNFLNPGMLGSQDLFKSEFATPIDKHGDKNKIELLRKMLYPFMLRRTKEQVAKDLPDKTEMILWCEMESDQRKIYNTFKEYYRKLILNKIDEEGMHKSAFYILEGLLKLRQICDSPAILNEEDIKYPNHSVKLEEIVRELTENTGSHKSLVFSQFVSILKLIEKELIKNEIPYLYLDGATKATDRKKLVKEFQEEDKARVMLISLKAGGVGLNLTEADYVYLVDPWWNPAVEQQAIDRTHRIGQTRKVFAYKMICKDSIEEKILMLQDKKKSLSKDIISGEASFIKKLSRDDIQFLFS